MHRYRWIIKYAKSETIQILNKHIWRHDTGATSKLTYSRRENYRLIFLRDISSNNYRSISNFGKTVDAISFLAHYYFQLDDLSLPDFLKDGRNFDENVLNVFFRTWNTESEEFQRTSSQKFGCYFISLGEFHEKNWVNHLCTSFLCIFI